MFEQLKEQVYRANMQLKSYGHLRLLKVLFFVCMK